MMSNSITDTRDDFARAAMRLAGFRTPGDIKKRILANLRLESARVRNEKKHHFIRRHPKVLQALNRAYISMRSRDVRGVPFNRFLYCIGRVLSALLDPRDAKHIRNRCQKEWSRYYSNAPIVVQSAFSMDAFFNKMVQFGHVTIHSQNVADYVVLYDLMARKCTSKADKIDLESIEKSDLTRSVLSQTMAETDRCLNRIAAGEQEELITTYESADATLRKKSNFLAERNRKHARENAVWHVSRARRKQIQIRRAKRFTLPKAFNDGFCRMIDTYYNLNSPSSEAVDKDIEAGDSLTEHEKLERRYRVQNDLKPYGTLLCAGLSRSKRISESKKMLGLGEWGD